jgi:hypothetical protein
MPNRKDFRTRQPALPPADSLAEQTRIKRQAEAYARWAESRGLQTVHIYPAGTDPKSKSAARAAALVLIRTGRWGRGGLIPWQPEVTRLPE